MTEQQSPPLEKMEQLVVKTNMLARAERFEEAITAFEKILPRLSSGTNNEKRLAASGFSYYGLCVAAVRKQYSDAMKYCQLSLKVQPKNADHFENLARVHILARSRKRAVDALFEGLEHDPNHKGINEVLDNIGRRREPVISFLPRNNILNVYFGKRRHEKFERRRREAMTRRQALNTDQNTSNG
jgi:tetratricopeptide (TPR) repeat protein